MKKPDNCEIVRNMLNDYSADNLSWFSARRVRQHLSHCAECCIELDLLLSTIEMVEDVGQREPPPGLWNGVYNRLAADNEILDAESASRRGWWRRPALSLIGGMAVIFLLLGLMVSRIQYPRSPDALDVAAYEYVEAHAMLAQNQPFADKINLSLIAASGGADSNRDEEL